MTKKILLELPTKKLCDRCGNDLLKGDNMLHFPFIEKYIHLCHICYDGLKLGLYRDQRKELQEIE